MIRRPLSIVGAGIVGLMIAFEASFVRRPQEIAVFDEGPDPRLLPNGTHRHGATYSGLDARHVSLTETAPWTSPGRIALMHQAPVEGGWNCLTGVKLCKGEKEWLRQFVETAERPELHVSNYETVIALNREGLEAWSKLSAEHPELFSPTESSGALQIVCANAHDLASEHRAEHQLDPARVSRPTESFASGLAPLTAQLSTGTLHGSFSVAGMAYRVKTLCARLITYLETAGVCFNWSYRVDRLDPLQAAGDQIWAVGASTVAPAFLAEHGVLLQGVAGCWVALPNPGFTEPFKILGPEPVNFINATPLGPSVLLSGGYGWVGERPYAEAESLSLALRTKFEACIARFFLRASETIPPQLPRGLCIRPSLPSGVPEVRVLYSYFGQHQLVCIGHAAGGFTQAPAVAKLIVARLG